MQAEYILTEKMTNRYLIQEQSKKKKIFTKSSKKIPELSEPAIGKSDKNHAKKLL